jgi:hypothetical protein
MQARSEFGDDGIPPTDDVVDLLPMTRRDEMSHMKKTRRSV